MRIEDIEIGYSFISHCKGKGTVIEKSKRSVKVEFDRCIVEITYNYDEAEFDPAIF